MNNTRWVKKENGVLYEYTKTKIEGTAMEWLQGKRARKNND